MTTPELRAAYRAGLTRVIQDLQDGNLATSVLKFSLKILDEYEALIKATTVKKRLNRMLEITED